MPNKALKKILIITSHYPPSNLTGVHRARLIAKYLPQSGWDPIVLTINEKFYEEKLDPEFYSLVPVQQKIERVDAYPITKPRIIGDIGLRAFFQLKKMASQIIEKQQIDFILIIIPSFYLALLGPLLKRKYGLPYGIDYIDPWVHFFPGSEKIISRHWVSTQLSKLLEPMAVKNASLITAVSASYIAPIFERNAQLKKNIKTFSFPYGWDPDEKQIFRKFNPDSVVFPQNNKLKLIYTGAFLPNSEQILNAWLTCIKDNVDLFNDVEFHFIGTGIKRYSPNRISIKLLAEKFNLFGSIIFEHPERISYFNMLHHISKADGLFILGSTEAHYTPSKLFNAFVTDKPIFAILHPSSTAKNIIEETGWGLSVSFTGRDTESFIIDLQRKFKDWKNKSVNNSWKFNKENVNLLTAQHLTNQLSVILTELS